MKDILLIFILFITGYAYSQKDEEISTSSAKVYKIAEKMPGYPGGDNALQRFIENNVRYPIDELRKSISGSVVVGFIVSEDGSINDIAIKKGLSTALDQEANRLVRSFPKFTPGMDKGVSVRVAYVMPVVFKIPDYRTEELKDRDDDSMAIYSAQRSPKAQFDKGVRLIRQNDNYPSYAYFKLSASRHYTPAVLEVGYMYEYGRGVTKSYDTAFRYLSEAADSGESDAQLEKGYMYEMGYGTDSSKAMAAQWYKKSADQNNRVALCNMAIYYRNGYGGLTQSDSLTKYYYKKSADLGFARAQFEIGEMYQYGYYGALPDTDRAMTWYEMAAQKHHLTALNNYAWLCYSRKTNITKAIRYSKECVDADPTDYYHLDTYAALLFVHEEYEEAKTWQKKALDNGGDKKGGYMERYGDILSKLGNNDEALKYWKLAVDLPDHGDRLSAKIAAGKYLE